MAIDTEVSQQVDPEIKIDGRPAKEDLPLLHVEVGETATFDQMKRYGYELINAKYQYAGSDCDQWLRHDTGWVIRRQNSGEILDVYNSD